MSNTVVWDKALDAINMSRLIGSVQATVTLPNKKKTSENGLVLYSAGISWRVWGKLRQDKITPISDLNSKITCILEKKCRDEHITCLTAPSLILGGSEDGYYDVSILLTGCLISDRYFELFAESITEACKMR